MNSYTFIDDEGGEGILTDLSAFVAAVADGRITSDTLVFDSASEHWRRAEHLDAYAAAVAVLHEPMGPSARQATDSGQGPSPTGEDNSVRAESAQPIHVPASEPPSTGKIEVKHPAEGQTDLKQRHPAGDEASSWWLLAVVVGLGVTGVVMFALLSPSGDWDRGSTVELEELEDGTFAFTPAGSDITVRFPIRPSVQQIDVAGPTENLTPVVRAEALGAFGMMRAEFVSFEEPREIDTDDALSALQDFVIAEEIEWIHSVNHYISEWGPFSLLTGDKDVVIDGVVQRARYKLNVYWTRTGAFMLYAGTRIDDPSDPEVETFFRSVWPDMARAERDVVDAAIEDIRVVIDSQAIPGADGRSCAFWFSVRAIGTPRSAVTLLGAMPVLTMPGGERRSDLWEADELHDRILGGKTTLSGGERVFLPEEYEGPLPAERRQLLLYRQRGVAETTTSSHVARCEEGSERTSWSWKRPS